MIQTSEIDYPAPAREMRGDQQPERPSRWKQLRKQIGQIGKFGVVGGLNTILDVVVLNLLLWIFPATTTLALLLFNSLAYSVGAINSFLLNKYWTFQQRRKTTWKEVSRFIIATLCGMGCNDGIIWCANTFVHFPGSNTTLWTNATKIFAIAGTVCISFFGMRLWVFVNKVGTNTGALPALKAATSGALPALGKVTRKFTSRVDYARSHAEQVDRLYQASMDIFAAYPKPDKASWQTPARMGYTPYYAEHRLEQISMDTTGTPANRGDASRQATSSVTFNNELTGAITPYKKHSLSVILPAYNEEQVIAQTVSEILQVLYEWQGGWLEDFEVVVVNDGSADNTAAIVSSLSANDQHVRLVSHPVNQGYGAALVTGFAAATQELSFFMDSDGQFDIHDLRQFFPFIDMYDAVLGYRIDRQDAWIRKVNAWGWKQVVSLVLGVHVRDLDCAFKLLHTDFLHAYPLQSRGATINAELLYKLNHAHCTYKEVGVHHLPRRSGQATGANPLVIARAFMELFTSARAWKHAQATPANVTTRR